MSVSTFAEHQSTQLSPPASDARIASLLPGLTDVVHVLNQTSSLVATSHECTSSPLSVTSPKLSVSSSMQSLEISAGWNALLSTHPFLSLPSLDALLSFRICSFYRVDVPALAAVRPSVLLTHLAKQRGPHEPDDAELRALLRRRIPSLTEIVSVDTRTLADVFELHRAVARAVHQPHAAVFPVAQARGRLETLRALVAAERRTSAQGGVPARKSVAIVQWAEPLFLAGDWVPGVVALGGAGTDGVTREGGPSVAVSVEALRDVDVVVFAVCAVAMDGCRQIVRQFVRKNRARLIGWKGRFVVTDATCLFSRPALDTVVESAEVIAEIVLERDCFGHKGSLWDEWEAP